MVFIETAKWALMSLLKGLGAMLLMLYLVSCVVLIFPAIPLLLGAAIGAAIGAVYDKYHQIKADRERELRFETGRR